MLNFILQHFSGLIAGTIAGTIAVIVHNRWADVEGAYSRLGHIVQAALGVVIAGGLSVGGVYLASLVGGQDVLAACKPDATGVLTPDCLDKIGALFSSKENWATVIGLIIALVGHITSAVKEQTRIVKLMAQKAGVAVR